jgi:hypothetical protein
MQMNVALPLCTRLPLSSHFTSPPTLHRSAAVVQAHIPEKARLALVRQMEDFKDSDDDVLMLPNLNNIERSVSCATHLATIVK